MINADFSELIKRTGWPSWLRRETVTCKKFTLTDFVLRHLKIESSSLSLVAFVFFYLVLINQYQIDL